MEIEYIFQLCPTYGNWGTEGHWKDLHFRIKTKNNKAHTSGMNHHETVSSTMGGLLPTYGNEDIQFKWINGEDYD